MLQSIENAFSLVNNENVSGIRLSTGNEVVSLSDLLSIESLSLLKESLFQASKYAGESSKSHISNLSNASKSSNFINSSVKPEGKDGKNWIDVYNSVAGKTLFQKSDPIHSEAFKNWLEN